VPVFAAGEVVVAVEESGIASPLVAGAALLALPVAAQVLKAPLPAETQKRRQSQNHRLPPLL
jgi:hypothetical protein